MPPEGRVEIAMLDRVTMGHRTKEKFSLDCKLGTEKAANKGGYYLLRNGNKLRSGIGTTA